ncbi:MAG: class I SAM-dependent DNA methyltransferase [Candidatus Hodarchaeota archaeon]
MDLKNETFSNPEFREFFRFVFCYGVLFPDLFDSIITDKSLFLEYINKSQLQLQNPYLWQLKWLSHFLEFNMTPGLEEYLTENFWWWDFFKNYNFTNNPNILYDLSNLHETLSDLEQRKKTGTFFTPQNQIKVICCYSLFFFFSNRDDLKINKEILYDIIFHKNFPNDIQEDFYSQINDYIGKITVLDPSCGIGVFLAEMAELLLSLYIKNPVNRNITIHEQLQTKENILTNLYGYDINPFSVKLSQITLCHEWLNNRKIHEVSEKDLTNFLKSKTHIFNEDFLINIRPNESKVDICIGNPPYVRHHGISKSVIKSSIQTAFPGVTLRWDKKADLYIYFWIKATAHLKRNGIAAFVLSRSWLSSRFASVLNHIFSSNYHLDMIIELPMEVWESAEVKTHIVIGHNVLKDTGTKVIQYIVWKRETEKLMHQGNELFSNPQGIKSKLEIKGQEIQIWTVETDLYRLTRIQGLFPFLDEPEIFFPILRLDYLGMSPFLLQNLLIAKKNKFCLLKDLGKLVMGSTTGVNRFFYLNRNFAEKFKLPDSNLKLMTKSPKEWRSIFYPNKSLKYFLHISETVSDNSNHELRNYLRTIQEVVLKRPFFKNKTLKNWYKIPLLQPDLLLPNMIYKRSFVAYNRGNLHIDKQWIGFWPYKKEWNLILLAFLNSSLGVLLREVQGTKTLGLGSLKLSLHEYRNLLVLDPRLMPPDILEKLENTITRMGELEVATLDSYFAVNTPEFLKEQQILDQIIIIDYLHMSKADLEKIQDILKFEIKCRFSKEHFGK